LFLSLEKVLFSVQPQKQNKEKYCFKNWETSKNLVVGIPLNFGNEVWFTLQNVGTPIFVVLVENWKQI
jgi:hypothetical protein